MKLRFIEELNPFEYTFKHEINALENGSEGICKGLSLHYKQAKQIPQKNSSQPEYISTVKVHFLPKTGKKFQLFREEYSQGIELAPSIYEMNLFFNDQTKLHNEFPQSLVKLAKLNHYMDWKILEVTQNVNLTENNELCTFTKELAFVYQGGLLYRSLEGKVKGVQ